MRVVVATTADVLASDLEVTLRGSDPLRETFVIVQGPGMSNWIRGEMVRRMGAWGGVETPFLRSFILSLAARVGRCAPPERGRDPLCELAYRIVGHARHCHDGLATNDERSALAPFLDPLRDGGDLDIDALLAQAHRLAECFDRYEMDRPDLVEAWEHDRPWRARGETMTDAQCATEVWQRSLWRAVVPGQWAPHELWRTLAQLIVQLNRGEMPEELESIGSVNLFGVSSVPKRALELLATLGRHRSVSVFMLAPTMELLERGTSARAVARLAVRQGTSSEEIRVREVREEGNPLVSTFGSLACESAMLISEFEDAGAATVTMIEREPTHAPSLLARLQESMNRHQPRPEGPDGRLDDRSIGFHGVTNATRAAEVAHDEILRAFKECPGLRQEDVLILAPRPDEFAGELEAVFRERSSWVPGLVLRLADAHADDREGVASAARHLLALAMGDQPMAQLRGFIECGSVRAAAGLDEAGTARVLDSMEGARGRRFFSADDRAAALGTISDDQVHTLSWSLDRVLAGIITGHSGAAKVAIGKVLPNAEQTCDARHDIAAVGRLLDAVGEFLRECRGRARSLQEWVDAVMKAFDVVLPSCASREFGSARESIEGRLRRRAMAATDNDLGALPWVTAYREIEPELMPGGSGVRFAAGGITMARMAPMRSVPFSVIIVVGIQHGEFPRAIVRDELDLAAVSPRCGDRKPRDEDQLLVLEALHAARERIRFIQLDRDAATGEALDESVIITKIIEACAPLSGKPKEEVRGELIRSHAPLASSPEAWRDVDMASFDGSAYTRAVAHSGSRRRGEDRRFVVDGAVSATTAESAEVVPLTARALARAIECPPREFVEALGLRVVRAEDELSTSDELVEVTGLDRWALRERCITSALDGLSGEQVADACRHDGLLPHGHTELSAWDDAWKLATAIATEVDRVYPKRPRETRVLRYRGDRKDQEVRAWIEHIVNSSDTTLGPSVRVKCDASAGTAEAARLDAVPQDQAIAVRQELEALAALARRELLPFWTKLLGAWIKARAEPPKERLEAARKEFTKSSQFAPALADDPHMACAFRGADLFSWGEQESTRDKPRSFDDLAQWVVERMQRTGWPP